MKKGVAAASREVAEASGTGKTSDALYKFLQRHHGTTFTALKEKILAGNFQISFIWLDGGSPANQINTRIGDKNTQIGERLNLHKDNDLVFLK